MAVPSSPAGGGGTGRATIRAPKRDGAGVVAVVAALALVLFCWPGSRAGVSGQAGQIREEVTVALKLLQVYVTAKDGKPVTDLTRADFEITDNGQKMAVTHFENHAVGSGDIAPVGPVAGPRLNRKFFFFFDFAFTDPRSSRRAQEAALNFVDTAIRPGDEVGVLSYSTTGGLTIHEYLTTDHAKIRDIIGTFGLKSATGRAESLTDSLYADELGQRKESGVPGLSAANLPGGENRAGSASSADSFFLDQAGTQTDGAVDDGIRQAYADQAQRFAKTLANLGRALRYVPGWKNLILFSTGISGTILYGKKPAMGVPSMDTNNPNRTMAAPNAYERDSSDTGVRNEFEAALKELKTSNSPIYALDCSPPLGGADIDRAVAASTGSRGLSGRDSLIQLGRESGGRYFGNTIDYKKALAVVGDITSSYYVLGYTVPSVWDGAYHSIRIRVVRPGCKVVSQNGYYNPKPFQEYDRFERLLQVTDLALSDDPLFQLPAEAPAAMIPMVIGGRTHLVAYAALSKDLAATVVEKNPDAYLVIYDEGQKKTSIRSFRMKPPEGGPRDSIIAFSLPTKPGRYSCRLVVQNRETGAAARGSASISFADPVAAAIWLDPPLLLKAATGWADLGASPEWTLSALFGYDPAKFVPLTDPLPAGPQMVLAAVRLSLGLPEAALDITATEIQGTSVSEVTVKVLEARQAESVRFYLLELAFGDLKRGPHTLTISARDKSGAQANASTAVFTVK